MEDLVKEKEEVSAAAAPEETELDRARREAAEYLDGWKRATADYANLKKDMGRQNEELSKYILAGFLEKFLPSVESFNKAVEQQPKIKEGEPVDLKQMEKWIEGVGFIRTQIEIALSAAGVVPIKEAGVSFDPVLHEAMMVEKNDQSEPGLVLKILEPGYKLYDRVLRPAKVIVAE